MTGSENASELILSIESCHLGERELTFLLFFGRFPLGEIFCQFSVKPLLSILPVINLPVFFNMRFYVIIIPVAVYSTV
jgi:hypothetical protein